MIYSRKSVSSEASFPCPEVPSSSHCCSDPHQAINPSKNFITPTEMLNPDIIFCSADSFAIDFSVRILFSTD